MRLDADVPNISAEPITVIVVVTNSNLERSGIAVDVSNRSRDHECLMLSLPLAQRVMKPK